MTANLAPAFVWGAHFSVGDAAIDDDHQRLIALINDFNIAADDAGRSARMRAAVSGLAAYAAVHFAREEAMMAQLGVDIRHAELHHRAHAGFADYVAGIDADTRLPGEVFDFLTRWLNIHILGVDHAMMRQARMIGNGMPAAEAFDIDMRALRDPAMNALLEAFAGHEERAERERAQNQLLLAQIIDGDPVPTFIVDALHKVTHWNIACAVVTGMAAEQVIGSNRQWSAFYPEERPTMADLMVDGALGEGLERYYAGRFRRSATVPGAYEAEAFFPHMGDDGRWLFFTAAALHDADGRIIGAIETLQDVTERRRAEEELHEYQRNLETTIAERTAELAATNAQLAQDIERRELAEAELLSRYTELTELNVKLAEAQNQLVQSEKLASIGQLAAGVAHEINNPIGYVFSNIGSLENYLRDIFALLEAYENAEAELPELARARVQKLRKELDVDFLKEDVPMLMGESKEGITRVKKIVQDLKDFSHVDSTQEWQTVDLHKGIDSTLNIVNNEIKYKADVVKEYGQLPDVECLPTQLNQVFMNLAVNAAHAMGDARGTITIRSGTAGDKVWVEVADTGSGIPEEIRKKIFDPFFTTKPIGKGTGLGLSLSYGIIQNHHGTIEVASEVGKGTTFRVTLPVRQPADAAQATAGEVQ